MAKRIVANEIQSDNGEATKFYNEVAYSENKQLSDIGETGLVSKEMLNQALPTEPISFIVLAGDPDTYNLTTDEVAAVNQLGRYPNTVFVIGGQEFKDIYPVYTGNPGTFSDIAVHLHSDGNGNNLDTTYVQFS